MKASKGKSDTEIKTETKNFISVSRDNNISKRQKVSKQQRHRDKLSVMDSLLTMSTEEIAKYLSERQVADKKSARDKAREEWVTETICQCDTDKEVLSGLLRELYDFKNPETKRQQRTETKKSSRVRADIPQGEKCQCRVWRGGQGGQCSARALTNGLCKTHNKSVSEYGVWHLGLITDKAPEKWGELCQYCPSDRKSGSKIPWKTSQEVETTDEEEGVECLGGDAEEQDAVEQAFALAEETQQASQ